jgi:transcriptional regulator with XRE-family HTH domain/3-methyladenine DNA glycosylase AlkC
MKKFAQLLERYTAASGMKQTHVASTANISYNYLQRLLAGDRNPSDQVVHKLAQALHLSTEQTGELLAAAGYAPPLALLLSTADQKQADYNLPALTTELNQATRLAQQFYRLTQDIPEALQASFLEEMKHLLGYIRYKYILSGGTSLLDLNINLSNLARTSDAGDVKQNDPLYLNLIAQLVGELHREPEEEDGSKAEVSPPPPQAVEDMLSAIDHLTGNILAGEMSSGNYQPHLIAQTLDMLREGAPWEIRRRIAEALPGLCQLDVSGAEHLMEALRLDVDEVRGVDIRRRVIEALPALIEASSSSLPVAIKLLLPKPGDDKYVAIATVEACGDIQAKVKQLLESNADTSPHGEAFRPETRAALLQQSQAELSKIQRQLLAHWEGPERESLQFSLALHNLLCAPDTLLLSLREGLQSTETLMQWVAARYLERLLSSRPLETLELYRLLLHSTTRKNVRRTVAKALPGLLECLKEASLPTRALARAVIADLATDPDIYIRRAVADHAMQIFHIDREFLLILLRHMHKDTDLAIRHRLQPVALRLAQVWLVWYAETAGLVDTKRMRNKAIAPFGE